MANVSRQQAREIVEDIMTSHGGITAADRAATRASVLRSLESVRENFAEATTVLSQQLYSKDTRFVYELIQNAEDNTYTIAEGTGTSPELTFSITPDQIVIDSNEDGFAEENVRAICKLGGSTKTASRGFIGEKGIGFKSVFKIASRVRVQSGPFCFAFEHGDDDHGLGMVTPINDEHEDLPDNVRTRFTLNLNQHSSLQDRVKEFNNLPDTLLLFLTKLKQIEISISISNEVEMSTTIYQYSYDETLKIGTLTQSECDEDGYSETSKLYYMERRLVKGLPTDKARPNTSEAEVVLAFPVDDNKRTLIEQQHVFASLPMRKVGFHFQIQSDFITQASREDLFDSAWNRALLDGIALTFRDAVLRFSTMHPLQFTWMRYVPSESISEPFWAQLRTMVMRNLANQKILQSRNGTLSPAKEMRHLPFDCHDENHEPLFASCPTGPHFLSPKYRVKDLILIKDLGIRSLNATEFCDRVSQDLRALTSRMKSDIDNQDWHTRVAKKLLEIAECNPLQVRSLDCIPLLDGSWVSAGVGKIYFSEYSDVPVPTDLGLRLVSTEAVTNTARKELFSALGVEMCPPQITTPLILRKYNTRNIDLQSSVAHLRWLYHFLPEKERVLNRRIPLFASDGVPTYQVYVTLGTELRVADLYFETKDDFGVKELCRERLAVIPIRKTVQYQARFINKSYLDAVDSTVHVHGASWLQWLENSAGVRRVPRLVKSADTSKLSELFSWLFWNRPEKIVGALHAHWSSYKNQMNPEIIYTLRKAEVLWKGIQATKLEASWIPAQELVKICQDFGLLEEMPLLKLPLEPDPGKQGDWKFLKEFGVGFKATTKFFLEILGVLRLESAPAFQKILEAYRAIERNSNSSNYDEIRQVNDVRAYFRISLFGTKSYVALPPDSDITSGIWITLDSCLWRAPAFIDYRHVLASYDEYRDDASVERLFTKILGVPNIECKHYTEQLSAWKARGNAMDNIAEVYGELARSVAGGDEIESLRQSFESNGLIYVPTRKQWFPPTSCMWTKSTRIAGKVAIAVDFPSLEDFFVRDLEVQEPDKSTYIMELETLCRVDSAPSILQVKDLLWEINSYEPSTRDVDILKPLSFLPIKEATGELRLHNVKDVFVLFDRQGHTETFQGKVASLDFDIEDIRLLRPIIDGLGLASRYTSKLAEKESCAPDAVLEPSLSRDLQSRAHAIFRCAVHYQDSSAARYGDSLHQRLREAEVHLSNDISSTVELVLNGMAIAKQSTQGRLHFQDDGNHIRLYVPRDTKSRELSYLTDVPERIVSQFEIKDQGAAKVFGDILKCSLSVLDDVLKSHGIVRVPGITAEPAPDDDQPILSVQPARNISSTESETRATSPSSTIVGDTTTSVGSNTEALSVRAQSAPFSRAASPGSARIYPTEEVIQRRVDRADENYRALLDHVIESAQSDRGQVRLSNEAFVPDDVFGVRSTNQLLHDMKIGVAGELYAFEFLLDLLPYFPRENWRSRIRKYVCVHEKYSDMTSYDGTETADIIYDDVGGELTSYLARCEYIDEDIWRGKTPKYLLEVKTTTQECDTRFFMSKSQVQRMERMVIPPGEAAAEVYVIMRVSNLCQEEIDLEFIVDPETRKRNGELQVTSESYTISHTCQLA